MLARIRKAQENGEGGFTLIELLVVMIIIGILAAIAIPAFLSQKKKGYEASMKSDLRSIATEVSTQLVDSPGFAEVTAGTNAVVVSAYTDSTKATAVGTPGTIALSNGNALATTGTASSVTAGTGVYCIALTSTKSVSSWHIQVTATGAAQQLLAGTC
jgi:type IV pilus assembly protein PilA